MKSVHTYKEFGSLEYKDRILIVRMTEGLEITETIIEKIFREAEKLAGDETFCVLADVKRNVAATKGGREYAAKNPYSKKHLAYATLADTMAVILLANFFIKVNKPAVPSRLFKKEEDAMNWLKGFLS